MLIRKVLAATTDRNKSNDHSSILSTNKKASTTSPIAHTSSNQALEEEVRQMREQLRKAHSTMNSQKQRIGKLESENELYRKFYVRNMADDRVEQTAEIEHVFSDFN